VLVACCDTPSRATRAQKDEVPVVAFNSVLYPQVQPVERRSLTVRRVVVGLPAAVGLGIALTLQVRSWGAVGSEAGGSCGTNRGPCPHGTTPMLLLSFFALFVLVPLGGVAIVRSLKGPDVASRLFGVVLLAAVVAGVYPGTMIFQWAHGKTLGTVWQAPFESGGITQGADGSWVSGSTVIRARFDGLTAYDVATGHQRWTFPIPGRQVLCAMSRHTAGDIGLIGYGTENKPCNRLVAVDLTDGRQLWDQARPGTSQPSSTTPDSIDIAGHAAVVDAGDAIVALDLHTGVKRWSAGPGKTETTTCRFDHLTGGDAQVVTEVDCPQQTPRIRALDPANGRPRWDGTVPSQADSMNISLLSASPAVVYVTEGGKRGADVVVAFDDSGRVGARIPALNGTERFDSSTYGFDAVPVRRMFVANGVFVTATRFDNGEYSVIGFDLTDGRRLWTKSLGRNSIDVMQVSGDTVFAISGSSYSAELHMLGLHDGKQQGGTEVLGLGHLDDRTALYPVGDYYAFVGEKGYSPWYRPLAVTKRK
jgi:outer membrane protein assembly factor BamB